MDDKPPPVSGQDPNAERPADNIVDLAERKKEIARLAAADPLEFEAGRKTAAEKLGLRATVLDQEVERARTKQRRGQDDPWRRHHRTGEIKGDYPNALEALRRLDLQFQFDVFGNRLYVSGSVLGRWQARSRTTRSAS